MTEKKPDLTSDDRARSAARSADVKDLGEADLLEYPHDARIQYDSDAVAALFQESGWSDFQMFMLAYAISVEHQGPNAVREIQKLSLADMLWARHLATSEPGGAQ